MGNNWVGHQVMVYLKERGENIVGLVVHPKSKQKYGQEIIETSGLSETSLIDGASLRSSDTVNRIRSLNPDIGLSVMFGYILKENIISIFPKGCVNIHPSYLPYNRGQFPNVWSLVDGTPAGVTLHYIDAGIDTGDLIARQKVLVESTDTGETLYRRLERASVELFKSEWPAIRNGTNARIQQPLDTGTFHLTCDVESIDEIVLDRIYTARELINVIRARTFPPHQGAYFKVNGRRVFLQLKLTYEEDL